MLFEERSVQELLRRVVFQVCQESAWRDDLIQEATIHLWQLEEQRPEQSVSWYVQSCRFHLLDHLAYGRSVDSYKRRRRLVSISDNGSASAAVEKWELDNPFLPHASEREILMLLKQWLTPMELRILEGLARGLGAREIARQLGISHQAVGKHRRKIATLAVRLGITLAPE